MEGSVGYSCRRGPSGTATERQRRLSEGIDSGALGGLAESGLASHRGRSLRGSRPRPGPSPSAREAGAAVRMRHREEVGEAPGVVQPRQQPAAGGARHLEPGRRRAELPCGQAQLSDRTGFAGRSAVSRRSSPSAARASRAPPRSVSDRCSSRSASPRARTRPSPGRDGRGHPGESIGSLKGRRPPAAADERIARGGGGGGGGGGAAMAAVDLTFSSDAPDPFVDYALRPDRATPPACGSSAGAGAEWRRSTCTHGDGRATPVRRPYSACARLRRSLRAGPPLRGRPPVEAPGRLPFPRSTCRRSFASGSPTRATQARPATHSTNTTAWAPSVPPRKRSVLREVPVVNAYLLLLPRLGRGAVSASSGLLPASPRQAVRPRALARCRQPDRPRLAWVTR